MSQTEKPEEEQNEREEVKRGVSAQSQSAAADPGFRAAGGFLQASG